MNKKIYTIIVVLIVILLVMVVLINSLRQKSKDQSSEKISPTNVVPSPTLIPSPAVIPTGNLPANTPVKFEDITVEYRSGSNIYVIFYRGNRSLAEQSFRRLLTRQQISNGVKTEYISLDPISVTSVPPPGYPIQ